MIAAKAIATRPASLIHLLHRICCVETVDEVEYDGKNDDRTVKISTASITKTS